MKNSILQGLRLGQKVSKGFRKWLKDKMGKCVNCAKSVMQICAESLKSLKCLKSLMQIFAESAESAKSAKPIYATSATYASANFVGKASNESTEMYRVKSRIPSCLFRYSLDPILSRLCVVSLIYANKLLNHRTTPLGRFVLPEHLPFSKPKVNWLLHASLICAIMLTLGVGNAWGAIEAGTYELITSTSGLVSGSHYIIASSKSNGTAYAIARTSKTDNRATVAVTVSSEKISVAANSDVMTFTLGGDNTNGWTFSTDNYAGTAGMLAATSSSNNRLGVVASPGNNGKWAITFSSGLAKPVAKGTYTRKYMKYNYNNGTPIFNCYSGSGSESLYIYKKTSGYSITYHCNDATSGCPSDASGQTALPNPLPTPTKTGFSFGGWFTNSTLTTPASAGATLSDNADLYAKWTCDVTLNRNGATETVNNVVYGTTLDDIDGTGAQGGCSAWTFVGWSKTQRAAQNNSTPMTLVTTVDGAGPYYAVYSHTEAGGTAYTSVSASEVTAGTYVIAAIRSASASDTYYAAEGTISSGDMEVESAGFTLTNGSFSTIPSGGVEFTFTGNNTDGFLINNGTNNLHISNTSSSRSLEFTSSTDHKWVVNAFSSPLNTNGVYLTYKHASINYNISENATGTTPIRGYASTTKYRAIYLFKKGTGSTTYYSTTATCCTPLGTISGSVSLGQLASPDPTKLKATWTMTAETGIDSYDLEVYNNSDVLVKTINDYSSGDEITGLSPCTTYYVKLYTVSDGSPYCDGGLISTSSTCTTLGYTLTVTKSNCSISSGSEPSRICSNVSVTYAASTGYALPTSITVTNAGAQNTGWTWNSGTGVLTINKANVTGNVSVTITPTCVSPTFSVHPASKTDYLTTDGATALGYTASAAGASLTQQWQVSTDNSNWDDIAAGSGGTAATYTPDISTEGTKYYRVIVTNSAAGCSSATATSNVATIRSTAPSGYCISVYNSSNNGIQSGFSNGGSGNEYTLAFTVPGKDGSSNWPMFWIGENNSSQSYSNNDYLANMHFTHSNATLGLAEGATGTLHIWDNNKEAGSNLWVKFEPDGYGLRWGGADWSQAENTKAFTVDPGDANTYWTELVTLDGTNNTAWSYYVGLKTATGYVYSGVDDEASDSRGLSRTRAVTTMKVSNGTAGSYKATNLNGEATGTRGKFRIWDNNITDYNFVCHFVPFWQLQYNSNGGSGSMSPLPATPVCCEASSGSRTVTVATSSFTAPQYKQFDHWNTASNNSGSNVNTGSYTLTGDVTLYAQWADIPVTALTLNHSSLTKYVGESTVTLSVSSVTPSSADPSVTWTSSDGTIASVTAAGVVSFLKAGTATITATSAISGGVTATCSVEVRSISGPTMKDTDGTTISGSGLSATWTVGTRTLTASDGTSNYKFKRWIVTNATPDEATNATTTLGDPTGNVTVVAEYYKPITVAWKVGTAAASGSPTTEVKYGTKISALPSTPADNAIASCGANKFMGWTASGKIEGTGHSAPADLFTTVGGATTLTTNTTYRAVFATAGGSPVEWVLTDIADLTGSDIFVLAESASAYAMTNDNGTSAAPAGVAITVVSNKITSDVAANMQWNISGNGTDGYIFYPNGSTTTWLYCNTTNSSGSNDNLRVGEGARNLFELDGSGELVTKDAYTDRYVRCYGGGANFRSYVNKDYGDPVAPKCYKKTGGGVSYTDYITGCCTPLDDINGSVTWNGSDPTEAVVSWDNIGHVSSWTVKYKTHAAGEYGTWAGDQTVYTKSVSNDSRKVTITGLTPCVDYDFQIIATPDEDYCNKDQTIEDDQTHAYSVDYSGCSNVTKTAGGATACGSSNLVATFTASLPYELPTSVSVSIGGAGQTQGTDFTWSVSAGVGTLTIGSAKQTGNIVIDVDGNLLTCDVNPTIGTATLDGSGTFNLSSVAVSVTGCSTGSAVCDWTDYGFVWGTSANPTGNKTAIGSDGTATSWSGTLTGSFSTGVTYYYRAYGKNSKDGAAIVYGSDATFIPRSVTFNVNGGSDVATKYVASGGTVSAPDAPTRSGYTFGGWYTDNGTWASPVNWSSTISANVTYYAKWNTVTYDITYEGLSGASNSNPTSYNIETPTITLADPGTRTGYTFDRWTCGGDAITQIVVGSTGDKTITANWTINQYNVAVEAVAGVTITATPTGGSPLAEGDDANVDYNKAVTLAYSGLGTGIYWVGWKVTNAGGDDVTASVVSENTLTVPAYAVTVTAVLGKMKAWCMPEFEITGDIHLTSVKGVYVNSTSTTGDLLTLSGTNTENVTRISIDYLDNNGSVVASKASSPLRLREGDNSGYVESDITSGFSTGTYSKSLSVRFAPTAYNELDNYTLRLTIKKGSRVLKTIEHPMHGRALPEEFVLAIKKGENWYALPNTILDNNRAITPTQIEVDDESTPTLIYAPSTTIYKGYEPNNSRYAALTNVYGVRLTDVEGHWLQVSSSSGTNYVWVSGTGNATCQDWWLSSSDFSKYTLKVPSSGAGDKRLGINNLSNIGFYSDGASGLCHEVYILPVDVSYFIGGVSGHEDEWSQTDNWENGTLPTSGSIVRVLAPATIGADETRHVAEVHIVTGGTTSHYKSGASECEGELNIAAGGELIVKTNVKKCANAAAFGTLTGTSASDLYIGSDASHGNGALVAGSASDNTVAGVSFYTKARKESGWVNQFIGVPLASMTAYDGFYGMYVYGYDDADDAWKVVSDNGEMYPFKAYNLLRKQATAGTLYMAGALNLPGTGATKTKALNMGSRVGDYLFANSWTAPIDVKEIVAGDFSNAEATIYIFNAGTKSDYDTNGGNYTTKKTNNPGQWLYMPVATVAASPEDFTLTVIPSMEAFMVKSTAASGSLTLDYKKHVYDPAVAGTAAIVPNRAPKRQAAADELKRIRLYVEGASGPADNLLMFEREDFSTGFDNGWEARKVMGSAFAPQMYAMSEDGKMAINCVPNFDGTVIGFKAGTEDDNYTFTFDYDEAAEALYLLDIHTNAYTRVTQESSYSFFTEDKEEHNRFILTRNAPGVLTGINEVQSDKDPAKGVFKFIENDKMYILYRGVLYDATGKKVSEINK